MFEMHPSKMKNLALVAAASAKQDGFTATSEAWIQIAKGCALESSALFALASGALTFSSNSDMIKTLAALLSAF